MMNTNRVRVSKIQIKKTEQLLRRFDADIMVLEEQLEETHLWDEEDSIIEEAIQILQKAKTEAELKIFESWHTIIPQ